MWGCLTIGETISGTSVRSFVGITTIVLNKIMMIISRLRSAPAWLIVPIHSWDTIYETDLAWCLVSSFFDSHLLPLMAIKDPISRWWVTNWSIITACCNFWCVQRRGRGKPRESLLKHRKGQFEWWWENDLFIFTKFNDAQLAMWHV